MEKKGIKKLVSLISFVIILAGLLVSTYSVVQGQRGSKGFVLAEDFWVKQVFSERTYLALADSTLAKNRDESSTAPPLAFGKSLPEDGDEWLGPDSLTLEWNSSDGAASYEYCIDTTNDNKCDNWVSTGTATEVTLSELSLGTTYYWQVLARNISGTTYANDGLWWHFTTVFPPTPDPFEKNLPYSGTENLTPWDITLEWGSCPNAESYEYCIATTDDNTCLDDDWVSNGTAIEVTPSGLIVGTTYYWQVRARNISGTTEANEGHWWHFTTVFPPTPDYFEKNLPYNNTENLYPNDISLEWRSCPNAQSYEYCIDTTNDNNCDNWVPNGTAVEVNPPGLSLCTIYYWQVRARNISGTTEADEGSWWHFSTVFIPEPSSFYSKKSPFSGTENLDPSSITLKWGSCPNAESYEYCIATTDDNTCLDDDWVSTGTALEVSPSGLSMGTTYYWQVRARNACGTTEPEEGYWHFTTIPDAPGELKITKVFNPGDSVFIGDFTIAYDCNDGETHDGTVTLAAGGSQTITGIPTGTTCTITEPTLPTAPTGWIFGTPSFNPEGGVVTVSEVSPIYAEVVVTNSISQVLSNWVFYFPIFYNSGNP